MRCGCPHCEAYMIQSEAERMTCVCPECGYRCNACLGTGTVISREQLAAMKDMEWFSPNFEAPLNDEEVPLNRAEGPDAPSGF